mgnify:CR=1 FL=1
MKLRDLGCQEAHILVSTPTVGSSAGAASPEALLAAAWLACTRLRSSCRPWRSCSISRRESASSERALLAGRASCARVRHCWRESWALAPSARHHHNDRRSKRNAHGLVAIVVTVQNLCKLPACNPAMKAVLREGAGTTPPVTHVPSAEKLIQSLIEDAKKKT